MNDPAQIRTTTALRIALTYAVISAIWILVSDKLAVRLAAPHQIEIVSIVKGWLFVIVTALLLYSLVSRAVGYILTTEAQMQLIFDSLNDMLYLFDLTREGPAGKIVGVNSAGIERMGFTRAELMQKTPWDLVRPDLREGAREALDRLRRDGHVVFETVHVTREGHEIPVEVSSRIVSMGDRTIGVGIARDISSRLRDEAERRESFEAAERDKRRFYRETILAVTGGKFEIGDPEDAEDWVKSPGLSLCVTESSEFAQARSAVVAYCTNEGLDPSLAIDFELAAGEAIGNAVKHARGGCIYAGRRNDRVWVAVVDRGTGIDTFTLPKVALLKGFSTKASMGLGYTLILTVCDHVKLATGPGGTTVLMEKSIHPATEEDVLLAVHSGIR